MKAGRLGQSYDPWVARLIIRWSIEHEKSNQTGNAIRDIVKPLGFNAVGTASWEGVGDTQSLLKALTVVIRTLHDMPGGGEVDHVWVYLDNPPPE